MIETLLFWISRLQIKHIIKINIFLLLLKYFFKNVACIRVLLDSTALEHNKGSINIF